MQHILKPIKTRISRLDFESIAVLFLLLFFFTEGYSKIFMFSGFEKPMFPRYLKAFVLGGMALYLFFMDYKKLLGIFLLTVIFLIGQEFLPKSFQWPVVVSFSKYIFPILLFLFFNLEYVKKEKKLFLTIFEALIVLESLLVFIGFLFQINIFKTYTGLRFGYNGLMIVSATGTYFFVVALCYFLVRYQEKCLVNWRFWITVLACLFLGTKSIYLALAAFSVFYIFQFIKSKKLRYSLFGIGLIVILGFAYYLFFLNPVFEHIRRSEGLLTSILSLRDQLFLNQTLPFIQNNWRWVNYFLGGVSDLQTRTQMAFVDLLYFWGGLGAIAYVFFFLKSYIRFRFKDPNVLFSLLLLLTIAFLAGNFFTNASLPIYLLVLREAFLSTENKPVKSE